VCARTLHVLHHRKSLGFFRIKAQALKRSQISHLSLRLLLMPALGSAPQTFDYSAPLHLCSCRALSSPPPPFLPLHYSCRSHGMGFRA